MSVGAQERDQREAAAAFDLLENPGWADVLRDVAREAKAARAVLFNENTPEQHAHARGSLAVLKNLVLNVHRRANKDVPPNVAALFE